jgi:hypothetical protein
MLEGRSPSAFLLGESHRWILRRTVSDMSYVGLLVMPALALLFYRILAPFPDGSDMDEGMPIRPPAEAASEPPPTQIMRVKREPAGAGSTLAAVISILALSIFGVVLSRTLSPGRRR